MPSHPFADTLMQIRACVDEPWESVAMTLAAHPAETLGHPAEPGTAAWHLRHIAEIFRLHARHLVGPETAEWPAIPPDAAAAIGALRGDLDRVEAWSAIHLRPEAVVDYGGPISASEMLGVMLRHIVWHAAAAHYWCCWRRPQAPETSG
jgi:hypothetical protein